MGVSFLQHRIVTGMAARTVRTNKKLNGNFNRLDKAEILMIIFGVVSMIYVYMLCLLLAGAVETASDLTT